jgi:hypothetical protein
VTRTFIYGSCVSRDTFELLLPDGFHLVSYVARQSLASAMSAPNTARLPRFETTSRFQRRMLVGDWEGSLLRTLRQRRDEIDLLLWDVFDERLGVNRLPNGNIVTRSVDSLTTGLEEVLPPETAHVPLGSPAHLSRFIAVLSPFRDALEELGLLDRTLLVAPPWATTSLDGRPAPSSFSLTPAFANEAYRPYYAAIAASMALPSATLSETETVADPGHRWGLAPFHYTPPAYERLAEQIGDFVEGLPPRD